MLAQDRVGQEDYAIWCFCHGLATTKVGSWLPGQDMPACGNKACKDLQEKVWPKLFLQRVPWSRRQMQECEHCKKERERRCVVLRCGSKVNISEAMQQFAGAAYVHPYNQPKYHAQILRAVSFARSSNEKIYWCLAEDWPLTADDEELSPEDIARMQEKFWSGMTETRPAYQAFSH